MDEEGKPVEHRSAMAPDEPEPRAARPVPGVWRLAFGSNGNYLLLLLTLLAVGFTVMFLVADDGPRWLGAVISGLLALVLGALTAGVAFGARELLAEGLEVSGVVTKRRYERNSWRIFYSYEVDGETFDDHFGMVAFRPGVKKGDVIPIAVDPNDHARSMPIRPFRT